MNDPAHASSEVDSQSATFGAVSDCAGLYRGIYAAATGIPHKFDTETDSTTCSRIFLCYGSVDEEHRTALPWIEFIAGSLG